VSIDVVELGALPFGEAVFEASRQVTAAEQGSDGGVGEDAQWTAAVGDDLLVGGGGP
jgi:hypothetical protein